VEQQPDQREVPADSHGSGTELAPTLVVDERQMLELEARAIGVDRRQPLTVRAVANPQQRPGARTGPDRIVLGVGSEPDVLADIDGRYCSTEVAGGFTGRVIGIEAVGGDATVTRFSYSALH
jgi:hypothetical protein